MALTWDVNEVANHETITTHPEDLDKPSDSWRWSPITEALVWATMHVGINRITAENADEFWKRVRMMEHINPSLVGHDDPRLTEKDVRDHIGLRTNASPLTYAKFKGQLIEWLDRESERAAERRKNLHEGKSLREQIIAKIEAKAKAD